jgi:hypothetical protein
MTHMRNRLICVWAFLTAITVASWLISRGGGAAFQVNSMITAGVLLIAAVKAQLVISYFMEVSSAPSWLKRTTSTWVVVLLVLLLAIYWASL